VRVATLWLVASCAAGCGSPQKMSPGVPVQKRSAGLGYEYLQRGKEIDRGDMVATIRADPDAERALQSYEPSNTFAFVLGGAGGALIGWPVGALVVGDPDPPWVLAAIGGGLVVLGIPLALYAEASLERAVAAYNAGLARLPPARARVDGGGVGPRRDRLDPAVVSGPTPEERAQREALAARQRAADEAARRERMAQWKLEHDRWQRAVVRADDARAPYTTWIYVTAGAGVVLLGAGTWLLVESSDLHAEARDVAEEWTLATESSHRGELERRLVGLQSDRDTYGVIGGSLLVAGGASLVTTVVLLVARPARPEEPLAPLVLRDGGGLAWRGSF
jgi:hypothetical protein